MLIIVFSTALQALNLKINRVIFFSLSAVKYMNQQKLSIDRYRFTLYTYTQAYRHSVS